MTGNSRTYDGENYGKHKWPNGWGSLCPDLGEFPDPPQRLLDTGVLVRDLIYNVSGKYAFAGARHGNEGTLWHGWPIPWSRLPEAAKGALIAKRRLTPEKLLTALAGRWGREFEER